MPSLKTKLLKHSGLLAIIFLALLLRLPSLFEPYWYGDEGITLTVGQRWFLGDLPYLAVYDNKPPLIYLIFGLAKNLFFLKLVTTVWVAATLVIVYFLARRISEDLKLKNNYLPILAAIIFTVFSSTPIFEGNIANGEIFLIFPVTVAATLIYLHAKKRLDWWELGLAGLMLAVGSLLKIPAVFDFVGLMIFLLVIESFKKRMVFVKDSLTILAGFIIPWLIFAAYFLINGGFGTFFQAVFGNNFDYVGVGNYFLIPRGGLLAKAILAISLIVILVKFNQKIGRVRLFLYLWLTFSLLGALLSGRPYTHYLIQALVPASLLAAFLLIKWHYRTFFEFTAVIVVLAGIFILGRFHTWRTLAYYQNFLTYTVGAKNYYDYQQWFDPRVVRLQILANYLSSNANFGNKLFVWGNEPDLYFLTKMKPAIPYITAYHFLSVPGAVENDFTKLRQDKPQYLVTIDNIGEKYEPLSDFVGKNYNLVFSYQQANIWRRR